MRRFLVTLLLFGAVAGQLHAQGKIALLGEVRDSLGIPLQFANVMALDTATRKMASFGVTNEAGAFRLNIEPGKVYKLQASFIGYVPFERIISLTESNEVPFLITLKNDVTQLSDVEVVTEMPVLIQGDTVTYKAEAFTQGNERKLENVLEDLPGFEVDEDGGVKVQGKSVSKVLVDGKEFFEGDTKLATKNLPANVVDKVQVLQNYNDVGPLGGVNNSDQLALNIQLKADKKEMVFGDVTAGGGPEGRYLAHANAFYYSPKTNINLIADANNVGQLAFTMRDYFRFSGGFRSLASSSGSSFSINSGDMGIPMAERNNAQDLNNQLAALSYNFTPSSKWMLSGFAIGSKVDNNFGSISDRTYVQQSDQETLASSSNVTSTSGLFKFGAKYIPNPDLQVDYSAFGRIADISNTANQLSVFDGNNNQINSGTTQQPFSVDQQLRAFYAPDEKNVVSFEGSFKYQEKDPLYDLLTTERPFAALIPTTGNSPFNLLQYKKVETAKQEAAVNYYRILNKTNHINLKVGNVYNRQSMLSNLAERFGDGTESEIADDDFTNNVDFTFEDYYLGLLYKTKLGDFELTPSLNLHHYRVSNTQLGVEDGFDKTLLLPSFNAEYNFTNSHSLALNYNLNAEFTDIENYAQGIVVNGYNALFQGNVDLRNSWYHNVRLNYNNFNMYNFLNIYGGLNYSRRMNDVSNIIQIDGVERINLPINIDSPNEVVSGFANINKRFDHFRVGVGGNWSSSITNNIISDVSNQNKNFVQTYNVDFGTRLWKALQVTLYYNLSFSNYSGNSTSNKFENHQPKAKLSFDFLKGFTFETEYEYNRYVNTGNNTETTFDLLDAELRYRKEGSPWEFKVEGMNLFNTTSIRRDSFSESLISTYAYYIQKRYWLFSVMYDL
ncbi:carboxypeptidase regulatory-like domain-containing protein [Roseivirga pacifica]|uniref:carboxypeptidase regulatory-like domain-containing protein n=1 Tax=Roseivirga pacifica TaxID=1267423 RepID=UPI00227A4ADD|nr:carboxypeptidase regulatory-like domain-containing protein [Roseivirga pacifica]